MAKKITVLDLSEMDKARFWSKAKYGTYCWEWQGSKNNDGYGAFTLSDDIRMRASRLAYIITRGEIPDDLHVLHRCDNPCCVNPSHLFTGTHQDNMLDKVRKGRAQMFGKASKYSGVSFRNDSNRWRAYIKNGRKMEWLGCFGDEVEAAKCRDAEIQKRGLGMPLNFPPALT